LVIGTQFVPLYHRNFTKGKMSAMYTRIYGSGQEKKPAAGGLPGIEKGGPGGPPFAFRCQPR
jgi:hypothetical protein